MRRFILFFIHILIYYPTYSQVKEDSAKISTSKKALNEGLKLITKSPSDTVLVEYSNEIFLPFSGKIIRNIYIENISFEKSIYGTEKPVTQKIGKLANKLHTDTREKIIHNHLFIRPNDKIIPEKLADNERFLRDKNFIMDSRIVVTPIEGSDSVDITVVTRDVFSLGARVGGSIPSAPRLSLFDANLDGRGQRLEFTILFDHNRTPKTGVGAFYNKSSILGSFIDLGLLYTQLNSGYSYGNETEYAAGIILDRKLVSPYSRLAGGAEWSRNWSKNVDSTPDSLFLDYTYSVLDLWAGYNFGVKKGIENRNRSFLALRILDGNFIVKPSQGEVFGNKVYTDVKGFLSGLTFYKRDFIKTRYIYGFGITEDISFGYSFTSTFGVLKTLNVTRPYLGFKIDYLGASQSGSFYEIYLNASSFVRNSAMEDGVINSNISYTTKAFNLGAYKIRNSFNASFTNLLSVYANEWLEIYSAQIPGLTIQEIQADQRNSAGFETTVYTPWSLLGFRIAPFGGFNWAMLKCKSCEKRNSFYTGISAGMRIRNENLIFGTIELKGTYLPKDQTGSSKYVFSLRQNLRYRKTDTFVSAPSLIHYNYN